MLTIVFLRLSRGDGGLAWAVGMMSIPFPFTPRANSVIVTILFPLHHLQRLQQQRRGGVEGTKVYFIIRKKKVMCFICCYYAPTFLCHHFTSFVAAAMAAYSATCKTLAFMFCSADDTFM